MAPMKMKYGRIVKLFQPTYAFDIKRVPVENHVSLLSKVNLYILEKAGVKWENEITQYSVQRPAEDGVRKGFYLQGTLPSGEPVTYARLTYYHPAAGQTLLYYGNGFRVQVSNVLPYLKCLKPYIGSYKPNYKILKALWNAKQILKRLFKPPHEVSEPTFIPTSCRISIPDSPLLAYISGKRRYLIYQRVDDYFNPQQISWPFRECKCFDQLIAQYLGIVNFLRNSFGQLLTQLAPEQLLLVVKNIHAPSSCGLSNIELKIKGLLVFPGIASFKTTFIAESLDEEVFYVGSKKRYVLRGNVITDIERYRLKYFTTLWTNSKNDSNLNIDLNSFQVKIQFSLFKEEKASFFLEYPLPSEETFKLTSQEVNFTWRELKKFYIKEN